MYRYSMDFNVDGGSYKNLAKIIENNGCPMTYIEVGVFEGSTLFWLVDQLKNFNPDLSAYAIDPHVGSIDMGDDFVQVKENFAHNLSVCTHKKITHIPKHSQDGLIDLINQNVKAELIYIDGDHRASEVLTDLVLSWKLLKVGGIILCDDTTVWKYSDKNGTQAAQMSVRMAVEMFIQCNWHKLRLINLPDGAQTAFLKISE